MGHIQELLADLGARIAKEELDVRERIKRIEYMANHDDVKEDVREEWRKFHLAIKPMQDQQRDVIKLLVKIESYKAPAPIVLPAGHTRLP